MNSSSNYREGLKAMESKLPILLLLIIFSCHSHMSKAAGEIPPTPSPEQIKAVNLGGWLVVEGWMKPSLFDEIPVNKDLLDGTQIQLKSVTLNTFLSAEDGGGSIIVANRSSASWWETFKLWRITETTFQFRVFNWQFFGVDYEGNLVATANTSHDLDSSHTFEIVRKENEPNLTRIKAPNGFYLQVKPNATVIANYAMNTSWGYDDPSVFVMTNVSQLKGEFQVTNGYGPANSATVMKEHWNSFIVEKDFEFISENGLNAVRIPVGWWIRFDQNPPHPFVGGSLQVLDNAICWAEKYNIKVIIDIHAMRNSQNGWEHSGTRDGLQSWGKSDDDIDESIDVVDFLTCRYANRTGFYAIELINEPFAPGVTLDSLKKYYEAGYNTVRKYSGVHVIMSNRLSIDDPTELIQFASNFSCSVIDVHYYNLYSDIFQNMTVQQNIDYINNVRVANLSSMMVSNGPLIFVGEWVNEMDIRNASKYDYQRFGAIQLKVYGKATFGWSYWGLKNFYKRWSIEWMIKNGYITL